MAETFGKMGAERGESCSNFNETYTSPCCYEDHDGPVTECAACGTPLECEEVAVPSFVCRIPHT